ALDNVIDVRPLRHELGGEHTADELFIRMHDLPPALPLIAVTGPEKGIPAFLRRSRIQAPEQIIGHFGASVRKPVERTELCVFDPLVPGEPCHLSEDESRAD